MDFDFSQTYLYKLHRLTTTLDTLFDHSLRQHSQIGLSVFTILLTVNQYGPVKQREIASFLRITPAAVSRQIELARKNKLITIEASPKDRRIQLVTITPLGKKKIEEGIQTLEQHIFQVFKNENEQTNLMGHIDLLQQNIDEK